MDKMYLVVGSQYSIISVCSDMSDIDFKQLTKVIGEITELWEVGLAHPSTPPGVLLIGSSTEITRLWPRGNKIEIL